MKLENVYSTLSNNIFISRSITPKCLFLVLCRSMAVSMCIYCYWNFYHGEIMKGSLDNVGTVYHQLLKLYALWKSIWWWKIFKGIKHHQGTIPFDLKKWWRPKLNTWKEISISLLVFFAAHFVPDSFLHFVLYHHFFNWNVVAIER